MSNHRIVTPHKQAAQWVGMCIFEVPSNLRGFPNAQALFHWQAHSEWVALWLKPNNEQSVSADGLARVTAYAAAVEGLEHRSC